MDEINNCCDDGAEKYKLGSIIRGLHGAFSKKFMACGMAVGLDEVTLMHGWIMGYLYHNQGKAVYQKTIESDFNIRRSTVTTILQLMEKKGISSGQRWREMPDSNRYHSQNKEGRLLSRQKR